MPLTDPYSHHHRDLLGQHAAHVAPDAKPLPKLRPGQVRCPVCLNGATLTRPGGNVLRLHYDSAGFVCGHRLYTEEVVPPSLLSEAERMLSEERLRTNQLKPKGRCYVCDKPVSGERRLCGRCTARRHQ